METSRGDATAATWIVRGDESRRRRGRDVDSPWRRMHSTGGRADFLLVGPGAAKIIENGAGTTAASRHTSATPRTASSRTCAAGSDVDHSLADIADCKENFVLMFASLEPTFFFYKNIYAGVYYVYYGVFRSWVFTPEPLRGCLPGCFG